MIHCEYVIVMTVHNTSIILGRTEFAVMATIALSTGFFFIDER